MIKLKNEPGKDNLVYGGATLVSSLIAGGHIDEFYLFLNPVLINNGMRIFELLQEKQSLKYVNTENFRGGTTLLHY